MTELTWRNQARGSPDGVSGMRLGYMSVGVRSWLFLKQSWDMLTQALFSQLEPFPPQAVGETPHLKQVGNMQGLRL